MVAPQQFCATHNIKEVGGTSPFKVRLPNSVFKGDQLPFGCLIDFKPSPVKGKVAPKFAPTAMPGVFLGWQIQPGGKFRGEYIVASLAEFKTGYKNPDSCLKLGTKYPFNVSKKSIEIQRMISRFLSNRYTTFSIGNLQFQIQSMMPLLSQTVRLMNGCV